MRRRRTGRSGVCVGVCVSACVWRSVVLCWIDKDVGDLVVFGANGCCSGAGGLHYWTHQGLLNTFLFCPHPTQHPQKERNKGRRKRTRRKGRGSIVSSLLYPAWCVFLGRTSLSRHKSISVNNRGNIVVRKHETIAVCLPFPQPRGDIF